MAHKLQIIVEGKDKKKFISLSTLVVGKESLLGDISYLYSPGSKASVVLDYIFHDDFLEFDVLLL